MIIVINYDNNNDSDSGSDSNSNSSSNRTYTRNVKKCVTAIIVLKIVYRYDIHIKYYKQISCVSNKKIIFFDRFSFFFSDLYHWYYHYNLCWKILSLPAVPYFSSEALILSPAISVSLGLVLNVLALNIS